MLTMPASKTIARDPRPNTVDGDTAAANHARLADEIAAALAETGYAITPHFLADDEVQGLADEARTLWENGAFRHARVGLGDQASLQTEVRTDRVCWLDIASATDAQRNLLQRLSDLREAVNRRTFAGLFDWEGHLALYPEGAFYRPHLDRFEAQSSRVLTTVLYLNTHDVRGAGGELRLWLETPPAQWRSPSGAPLDVVPHGGTLVTFWSDQFVHEVLPARFERLSITGWFRHRTDNPLRNASMD